MSSAAREERTKRKLSRAEYDKYLPLVRRTAMRLARKLPSHITVADLVGYGWVGLLDAFERAAPGMSQEEFEAYAMYRVRGAALDYLRSLDPASRAARALSRKVAKAIAELGTKLGRQAEEDEIAKHLDMSVDEYRDALEQLAKAGMTRLEMLDIDELAVDAAEEEGPDEKVTKKELAANVAAAIDQLPQRLQLVLALYYQEERTMREIGVILEVTESRVCQLHSEAIHRLRAATGRE